MPPNEPSILKSMYGKSIVNGTAKVYKRYKDKEKMFGDMGRWQPLKKFTQYLFSLNNKQKSFFDSLEPQSETVTLYDYLNREDVRQVLNVPPYVPEYREIYDGMTYYPNLEGSGWIYEIFNKYGYKMLHMMGDTDGILSMKGMWSFINSAKWMNVTK